MRNALILLSITYILSQFFRAFLAVLTPVLGADLGATALNLSQASGAWFLVFAAMQLPVGWALDTVGPRRTTALLLAMGCGGGCAVFAVAGAPWHITVAMGLIGVGCSPVLMASFFLIARGYSAQVFATYAGLVIAVGNLGNIGASLPMALMVDAIGWRAALLVLGGLSVVCAALIYWITPDPAPAQTDQKGSLWDLLRLPALWLILPLMLVNYAPAAGIRGLWAGPFLEHSFLSTASDIGVATMVMGVAMVLGSAVFGPLERALGTRKWLIFTASLVSVVLCFALGLIGANGYWGAVAIMAAIGVIGTGFPVI
ncbi:MAG: MFS transporter, partial [Pseudomonadota bacterium]